MSCCLVARPPFSLLSLLMLGGEFRHTIRSLRRETGVNSSDEFFGLDADFEAEAFDVVEAELQFVGDAFAYVGLGTADKTTEGTSGQSADTHLFTDFCGYCDSECFGLL